MQLIGMTLAKLSPQMPSDTAIESALVPTALQVKVAIAALSGASEPVAGVPLVQL